MPESWVSVEKRKFPARPIGRWEARVLAEDEFGLWLAARAGERNRHIMSGVQLLPPDRWWVAWWWDDPAGRWCAADVATPACWSDGIWHYDDLEIDVALNSNGMISVVDLDEFEQARVEVPYSQNTVTNARHAMDDLVKLMSEPAEPFRSIGLGYLQQAFQDDRVS